MTIRKTTKKDMATLKKLFYESMKEINRLYDDNGNIDLKNVRKYLNKRGNFNKIFKQRKWFLAEEDGGIVGFIDGKIEKKDLFFRERKVGAIYHLFIEKDYRNRGIGTELIKVFVGWLKANKIKFVELNVSPRNGTAIKFYEKMGFKESDMPDEKQDFLNVHSSTFSRFFLNISTGVSASR